MLLQTERPTMTNQLHIAPDELTFIQSRVEINPLLIEEYAEMMQAGITFDAAQAVQDNQGQFFVFDGYHRGEAARRVGQLLLVDIISGSRTEAEWLALAANQKHGLRRTHKDKQHVVRKALNHPNGVALSDREIARHCGVDHKTVGKVRRQLELSGEIPQMEERTVTRNGTTYQQATSNIGQNSGQTPTGPKLPINQIDHKEEKTGASPLSFSNGYTPEPQAFECPRCTQERIVGVNGSRRWCLNCGAEWPSAMAFLAEVHQPVVGLPLPQQLQRRFAQVVGHLDESQLAAVEQWLAGLEQQVEPV